MFYFASKILGFFAVPSNSLAMAGLAGALLVAAGARGLGIVLLVAAVVLIALCGLSPLGYALMSFLEERFPEPRVEGPVAAIIVLGGSFDTHVSRARNVVALNEAAERLTELPALARRFPGARLIFSGGGVDRRIMETANESALARRLLGDFGMDVSQVLFEDRSRNTHENAIFTAELLRNVARNAGEMPGAILLVTSAYHMPRAVGAFRKAGLDVTAMPTDFRTRGPGDVARFSTGLTDGLRRVDTAVKEFAGLLTYRWMGYTDALMPAPQRP